MNIVVSAAQHGLFSYPSYLCHRNLKLMFSEAVIVIYVTY